MKLLLTLLLFAPLVAFGSDFSLKLEDRFGNGNSLTPKTITWLSLNNISDPKNIGHRSTCSYSNSSFGPPLCSQCTFVNRIWYQSINGKWTTLWSDHIELPSSCHQYSRDDVISAIVLRSVNTGRSFGTTEGVHELAPNTAVCAQLYGVGTTAPATTPWDFENYGTPLEGATCQYIKYDPVPPVCTTSVPNINHGVIDRASVIGYVSTAQGNITCNKSANASIYVVYNDPVSKTDVMKSPTGSQLPHTLTISLDGKDYVGYIESTIEAGNTPIYISDTLGTEAVVAGEYLGSTVIVFDYR